MRLMRRIEIQKQCHGKVVHYIKFIQFVQCANINREIAYFIIQKYESNFFFLLYLTAATVIFPFNFKLDFRAVPEKLIALPFF